MSDTLANIQQAFSSSRVLVIGRLPERLPTTNLVEACHTARTALGLLQGDRFDLVLCSWPQHRAFVEHLTTAWEVCPVTVMMMVPVGASRAEAVAFARRMRHCTILPTTFSLQAVLSPLPPLAPAEPSAHFRRRLPRLARLWGLNKTGVVQFVCPDGAWDSISIKRGGLVAQGDLKVIQRALQSGQIRFLQRQVPGDPSRLAFSRLLMVLAGAHASASFIRENRDLIITPVNPGRFPVSAHMRQVLQSADGTRSLRTLLSRAQLTDEALSQELHALVLLSIVQLRLPGQKALTAQPRRMLRPMPPQRMQDIPHGVQAGRFARWQESRAHLRHAPEPDRERSRAWRQIFTEQAGEAEE